MRKRLAGTPSQQVDFQRDFFLLLLFGFFSMAKAACPSTFINFLSQKYRSQWLMSTCNSFMYIVAFYDAVFDASKRKKNICVKIIIVKSTIKNFHYISWFDFLFCSARWHKHRQTDEHKHTGTCLCSRGSIILYIAMCQYGGDGGVVLFMSHKFNENQNEANPTHIHRWHSNADSRLMVSLWREATI